MDNDNSKIHINPAFLNNVGEKNSRIHINPAFVNKGKPSQSLCPQASFYPTNFQHCLSVPSTRGDGSTLSLQGYSNSQDLSNASQNHGNQYKYINGQSLQGVYGGNILPNENITCREKISHSQPHFVPTLQSEEVCTNLRPDTLSYKHHPLDSSDKSFEKYDFKVSTKQNMFPIHSKTSTTVSSNKSLFIENKVHATISQQETASSESKFSCKQLSTSTQIKDLSNQQKNCLIQQCCPSNDNGRFPPEKVTNSALNGHVILKLPEQTIPSRSFFRNHSSNSQSSHTVNQDSKDRSEKDIFEVKAQQISSSKKENNFESSEHDGMIHDHSNNQSAFKYIAKVPEYSLVSKNKLVRKNLNFDTNLLSKSKPNTEKYKYLSSAKLIRRCTKSPMLDPIERNSTSNQNNTNPLKKFASKGKTNLSKNQVSTSNNCIVGHTPQSAVSISPSKFKVLSKRKLIRRKSFCKPNCSPSSKVEFSRRNERYKLLSKNKLLRRNSKSPTNVILNKYKVLSKNKLVSLRSKSETSTSSPTQKHFCKRTLKVNLDNRNQSLNRVLHKQSNSNRIPAAYRDNWKLPTLYKFSRQNISPNKGKNYGRYKLLTKNKIIRRRSTSLSSDVKLNTPPTKTRMKLINSVTNPNLSYVVIHEGNGNVKFAFKTQTKLINKKLSDLNAMDFLHSKAINHKNYSPSCYKFSQGKCKTDDNSQRYPRRYKRKIWSGKSDTFVNIGGSLYKMTSTSLKKHDMAKVSSQRKKKLPEKCRSLKPGMLIEIARKKKLANLSKRNQQCSFFSKTGRCRKNEMGMCSFLHDKEMVAICTKFLLGRCSSVKCPFLHKHDKSRMPVCSHFLKASCTKENCLYRHVRVNPCAPVCLNFLQGNCLLDEECKKKHILICEEFIELGRCKNGKQCPLSHPKGKLPNQTKNRKRSFTLHETRQFKKLKKFTNLPTQKGVLGLPTQRGMRKIPQVKLNTELTHRYFGQFESLSCQKKSETIVESNADESHSGNSDLKSGSHCYSPTMQEKRDRMIKRVQHIKNLYNVGDDCDVKPESLSSSLCQNADFKVSDNSHVSLEHSEDFEYGCVPLPDSLPDFIPLSLPKKNE